MIHIIGDSHALTFQNAKNVEVHWMGAATAFNLWKKNKVVSQIFRDNNSDSNRFFFCLGEIDCRIHVYNYSMLTGVPEYVIINNTVASYTNYLFTLRNKADIAILAVPPQGFEENVYGYPYYASREHRQEITDDFNMKLESEAHRIGVKFVDIWYEKPDFRRSLWKYSYFKDDLCHIRNEIVEELVEKYKRRKNVG